VCCRFLSEFSLLQVPRPAVVRATQLGLTMAKKKRQAQRAAVKQPAPKKRQRGRAKASASADAEQGSSTQPKKKSRAGQREPSSSHYSVLNKRRYVASQPATACTPSAGAPSGARVRRVPPRAAPRGRAPAPAPSRSACTQVRRARGLGKWGSRIGRSGDHDQRHARASSAGNHSKCSDPVLLALP
jgi:hypothetical protein